MNKFNLRDKVKIEGTDDVFTVETITVGASGGIQYFLEGERAKKSWQPESLLSAYIPRPEPKFKVGDHAYWDEKGWNVEIKSVLWENDCYRYEFTNYQWCFSVTGIAESRLFPPLSRTEPRPEPKFKIGDKATFERNKKSYEITRVYFENGVQLYNGTSLDSDDFWKLCARMPEDELSPYHVVPRPAPKFKVGDKVRLEGNDKVFEVSGISVDQFLDGQDAIRYYLLNEWPLVKGVNERDLTLYAEPKFKVGDIVNNINSNNTGFYTVKEIFARENSWRYHLEYQCGSWQTNADEDQIVLYIEPKFKIGDAVYRASRDLATKVFDVDFEDGRYLYTVGGILFSQKVAEHELELIPKAKFKLGDSVYWDHDKSTSKVTMVQWNQLEKRYRYHIGGGLFNQNVAEDHLEFPGAKAAREGFELAQKVAPFLKIDWTLALGYRIAVKPQEDNQ